MKSWTNASLAWAAALVAMVPAAVHAQAPKANGETLNIQNYAGTTGNMHAIIAKEKGFCDKYGFKCEIKVINSTSRTSPTTDVKRG